MFKIGSSLNLVRPITDCSYSRMRTSTTSSRWLPSALTRRVRCTVRSDTGPEPLDYYDILEVDPDAAAGDIKYSFRKLQKQYHPDRGGSGAASTKLNEAYRTLMDPGRRASYDRRMPVTPAGEQKSRRSFTARPGLVGPLGDAKTVIRTIIAECSNGEEAEKLKLEYITWLREWAKTFMFAADLPLPLPLQCDAVDNGVRLAFITAAKHRIRSSGELSFTVNVEDRSKISVAVRRTVPSGFAGPIAGEHQVMNAFNNALKDKNEKSEGKAKFFGVELTGFAASAAAQIMPAIITLPVSSSRGASYEAYHLKPVSDRDA